MIHAGDIFELRMPWRTKLVLLALLDDSGWRMECVPSVERLAWKTRLTPMAVEKCLADLREAGALRPVAYAGGVPRQGSGMVQIELSALPKRAPYRGARACQ